MRRSGLAARSCGLRWPSKPAATASGWPAGSRRAGVEAHVIHPSSVAVSREHRPAKTDRLDTELLKRGFLGWLRGERAIAAIGAPQRSHAVDGGGRTVARSRHRLRVDQLAGPRAAFPVLAPAAGVAFAFAVKLPGEGEGSGMACRPAVSNALTARHLVLHSGHNGHGARTDDCRRGRQAAEPPRAATPAASAAYDGK